VETRNVKIFINPSVALGPKRFDLPPSKKELETLDYYKKEIHRKDEDLRRILGKGEY